MKKHTLAKAGCSLIIGAFGVLLPLSAAQADNMDQDRMYQDRSGSTWSTEPQTLPPSDPTTSSGNDTTHPPGRYDNQTAPQGAQGPIRSDMSTDSRYSGRTQEWSKKDRELQNRLFPLPGEGDPRPAIGGHNATGSSNY